MHVNEYRTTRGVEMSRNWGPFFKRPANFTVPEAIFFLNQKLLNSGKVPSLQTGQFCLVNWYCYCISLELLKLSSLMQTWQTKKTAFRARKVVGTLGPPVGKSPRYHVNTTVYCCPQRESWHILKGPIIRSQTVFMFFFYGTLLVFNSQTSPTPIIHYRVAKRMF